MTHSCPFMHIPVKTKNIHVPPSTYLCPLHARARTKTLHSLHLLPPAQYQIFVRGPGTVCPRPADCQYQAQGRFFGTRLESPSVSPSKLFTIHYSLAKRLSGAASVASLSSRARERRGQKGVHAPTPLSFCYKRLFKCNILTCKEKKNVKKLGAFKITSYLCNENVVFRHQGGGLQYR